MKSSVLVTGASSGIGQATARVLAESGMQVFAGVRQIPTSSSEPHLTHVILDVTNAHSIQAACEWIKTRVGDCGLQALVNNAGVGELGPIEYTPLEKIRATFEVNAFGMIAVTQAFLPLLRQGGGRIVNLSSVGGLFTVPFGASLCASKHAVEAISDAFRQELWTSRIPVTILEPASINSGAAEKIAALTESQIAALPHEGQIRYGKMWRAATQATLRTETHGSPPEVVAQAILEVILAEQPPIRRLVGQHAHLLNALARLVPSRWRDALLRRVVLGNPPLE